MTAQNRTTLKAYFNTADIPTEAQFADLVDSFPLTTEIKAVGTTDGTVAAGDDARFAGSTRLVASRCQVPGGLASYQQMQCRTKHYAAVDITSVQLVYVGWYLANPFPSNVSEYNSGITNTLSVGIEYPIGTVTRVTFSGSDSGSLTSGSRLVSDSIAVTIPAGEPFFVRMFQTGAASVLSLGGDFGVNFQDSCNVANSGLSDISMSGSITNTFSNIRFPPAAIVANSRKPAFGVFGDSRSQGTGDTYSDGYMLQGDLERCIAPFFPTTILGLGGERISHVSGGGAAKRIAHIVPYITHAAGQHGTNDLFNSVSAATIETQIGTFRNLLGKPLFYGTIGPASSSTDSWATTVNQTTRADNAARVTLNTSIRRGLGGVIAGYIETADPLETSRGSGIWKAGYTSDGVHANQTGYLAIAATRPALDCVLQMK